MLSGQIRTENWLEWANMASVSGFCMDIQFRRGEEGNDGGLK